MTLRDVLKVGEVIAEGLDTLEKLFDVDADKAAAALTAGRVVVKTVRESLAGTLAPQAALTRLELLLDAVTKRNADALAKLAAKFGKS